MTKTYIMDSSTEGLPSTQSELLTFLVANVGQPMSIRRMMNALGLRSPAPVLSRLRHLEERGKLKQVA